MNYPNPYNEHLPDFSTWSQDQKDIYLERIAIMREANNIPDASPTPREIIIVATNQALNRIVI